MNRHICIHGHFYQPPRENPWLEEIEVQDSAYPYHDWNERITAECYAINAASRILDPENKIIDIINNYCKISFNFGPTLLSWLKLNHPEVYQSVLTADKESRDLFSGHGSALAQIYNHIIMPLANSHDKRTQIIWGIRDFEYHFKRKPEGMWLSETAVDLETLDLLAEHGIKFTILAPYQAKTVRKITDTKKMDVIGGKIDPKIHYICTLPSGRNIILFFYDGPISRDIAFSGLLRDGQRFAERLTGVFAGKSDMHQLVHIATDGETYGHHHRFGDMALAYCLYHIESNKLAHITIYGEYLEKFQPEYEVEIIENTSWSCFHGVERWKSNCGCSSGMRQGWTQEWRAPLRAAMNWLRDTLSPLFTEKMSSFVKNPWQVRDDYIAVILDRSPENTERFIAAHAIRPLSNDDKVQFLKLLELQRHAMFMFTSCGWFFDDISGIESKQVLQYAARAIQLAKETNGVDLEPQFVKILDRAPSNDPVYSNGAHIYTTYVKPAAVDLRRVAAHFAITSFFKEYAESDRIYCFTANDKDYDLIEGGVQKLATGKIHLKSDITWEEKNACFAALHLGNHNIIGGVFEFAENNAFDVLRQKLKEAFMKGDIPEVFRLIDRNSHSGNYSLWHLFGDEQRKILNQLLDSAYKETADSFRHIFDYYYPIMQVTKSMKIPLPDTLAIPAEFTLNADIRSELENESINVDKLQKYIDLLLNLSFKPDKKILNYVASRKINLLMEKFLRDPAQTAIQKNIERLFKSLNALQLDLDIWKAQNIYFSMGKEFYKKMSEKADKKDANATIWLEHFHRLGDCLRVKVNHGNTKVMR